MSSLYANPNLSARMEACGVVDRFIRAVTGTYEQVVSVSIATDPHSGLVTAVLSVDQVMHNQTHGTTMLAVYPISESKHADADGAIVAAKYDLTLRKAHSGVGWVILSSPKSDQDWSDARELQIGG